MLRALSFSLSFIPTHSIKEKLGYFQSQFGSAGTRHPDIQKTSGHLDAWVVVNEIADEQNYAL